MEGVGGRDVRKGTNGKIVELHHIPNEHSDGMLAVLLPVEKVLWTADITVVNPNPVQLVTLRASVAALNRLKLDYAAWIPAHPPEPGPAPHEGGRVGGGRHELNESRLRAVRLQRFSHPCIVQWSGANPPAPARRRGQPHRPPPATGFAIEPTAPISRRPHAPDAVAGLGVCTRAARIVQEPSLQAAGPQRAARQVPGRQAWDGD